MLASAPDRTIAPSAAAASAVAALRVDERDHDAPGLAIPRPEIHVVVRFGASTRDGLDVHAVGVRQRVLRKVLRGDQRTVMARLHLGAHHAVLGVPASAIGGGVVPIEELWGPAAARALLDRLADTHDTFGAARVLDSAIAERVASQPRACAPAKLVLDAAARLTRANVNEVADDLGVSERHLRRVFRETVGLSPKTFARIARFRSAIRAARAGVRASWASIATSAGYYDQAHLIAEFRMIAGVTPERLLGELRACRPL